MMQITICSLECAFDRILLSLRDFFSRYAIKLKHSTVVDVCNCCLILHKTTKLVLV